jgi:polyhydroxyalkanoate synthesis regulator phasin
MKELLKNVFYIGVGAAFLTKEKIEEVKKDLIDRGKLSQEEGKQFVDDLLKKSESARDQLELKINQMIEEQVKKLNLASSVEVAELRRKIEEMQVVLNKEVED